MTDDTSNKSNESQELSRTSKFINVITDFAKKTTEDTGENIWNRRSRSFALLGFILFCIWYVVQALVAYQFQHKTRNTEVNGQTLSIDRIVAYSKQNYDNGTALRKEKSRLVSAQSKVIKLKSRIETISNTKPALGKKEAHEKSLIAAYEELQSLHCNAVNSLNRANKYEIEWRNLQRATANGFGFTLVKPQTSNSTSPLLGLPEPPNTLTPPNQKVGSELGTDANARQNSTGSNKSPGNQSTENKDQVPANLSFDPLYPFPNGLNEYFLENQLTPASGSSLCPIDELNAAVFPPVPILDPRVSELLDDYKYLARENSCDCIISPTSWKSIGHKLISPIVTIMYLPNFIEMPNQMLVLAVVLLMGALGATLELAQIHLYRGRKMLPWDTFLFMPLLGSITAFAVYILAKAGVIIIADFGENNQAVINPYFISFIGLVSGMLTNNALRTIRNVGLKWFKNSEGKGRYWLGDAALVSAKKDRKDLIKYLETEIDVNSKIAENWLGGKVLVPEDAQYLIAAWVGGSRRIMFTDILPSDLKNAADAAPTVSSLVEKKQG